MSEAQAAAPPTVNLEAIVERYIQLRDQKSVLKSDYEKSVAAIDTALERIEGFILRHLNDHGVESVRTAAGTAYKSQRTSATVADWDSTWNWILEDLDGRKSIIEKRVNKSFVEAHMQEHNDVPPGVNVRTEHVVNIRRS